MEPRLEPREGESDDGSSEPRELSSGGQMFANRLKKNQRQLRRWADREAVQCYRLYDADMPEYAVAVDLYGDHLHVAEYRAPKGVDEAAAARRLDDVRQALPGVTGIPPERIHFKQRARQKGSQQYQREDSRGEFLEVREGEARLLVNLTDYLDTGLFLDHRPLRLRLASEVRDKDFLNLFCYPATASVHCALAGAASTTSVDLSRTYLDWGKRNFALNGIETGAQHRFLRFDVRGWLQEQSGQNYDLVLLDPPSFSNSKQLEHSFDVQRDHPELIERAMACLRPGGAVYFSNNLRKFRLDPEVKNLYQVEDISAQTIDVDFRKNRSIHHCWRIQA